MKSSANTLEPDMASSSHEEREGVQRVNKAKLLEERAKKLSSRFGLHIRTWEWRMAGPEETVLRVDKPICMRARWTCHRCKSSFVSLLTCPNCDHARCTKCPRFPPGHQSDDRKDPINFPEVDEGLAIPDYNWQDAGILLTRPSRTGGQDLILKKPRQRVRRSCHECHTTFAYMSNMCEKCSHLRCTDCPREP